MIASEAFRSAVNASEAFQLAAIASGAYRLVAIASCQAVPDIQYTAGSMELDQSPWAGARMDSAAAQIAVVAVEAAAPCQRSRHTAEDQGAGCCRRRGRSWNWST